MDLAAVILAAGKGTRMKSSLSKVLHSIAGSPMVNWVIRSVEPLNPSHKIVVVNNSMDQVHKALPDCSVVVQKEQLGTADAVKPALAELGDFSGSILVVFGDTPFLKTETLQEMLEKRGDSAVVVLGFRPTDPAQYGRLVTNDSGHVTEIVEYVEATEAQRAINLCNSGVMLFDAAVLREIISQIKPSAQKGEYYLTDCVELANAKGLTCAYVEADEQDLLGVNSRIDLAGAEAIAQKQLRYNAMAGGVTLLDPDTVYFSFDTKLGRDVVVEPNVYFGPNVTVADDVTIRAFSHLEGTRIECGATVGPFARLRPGAEIGQKSKIGNFVEIKKSKLAENVKVSHLSYIGDAEIARDTNVGAGTITCNYDGFNKHKTSIGEGVFIGSNTSLVAPVSLGNGAMVAAGSVITKDVEDNAIALERSQQKIITKAAERFRRRNCKNK